MELNEALQEILALVDEPEKHDEAIGIITDAIKASQDRGKPDAAGEENAAGADAGAGYKEKYEALKAAYTKRFVDMFGEGKPDSGTGSQQDGTESLLDTDGQELTIDMLDFSGKGA